jgi:thiamine transport system permease protein
MAGGAEPVSLARTLALLLLLLVAAPVAALLWQGGASVSAPPPSFWAALRFTVLQAALSAILSALLAVPVAKALARRHFPGRGVLISLLGAPFLLPVVVAILGLLAVFGRQGPVNDLLVSLGLPRLSIYGLQGVLLAHVFLNLPFAVRMILQGWQAIPAERLRLAATLGLPPGGMLRHLELPMLRQVLPGAVLVIFLLCLTSFVVALILGGGPKATTLELAIYQALRFDFDLSAAAGLALAQYGLCLAAVALAYLLPAQAGFGAALDREMALPAPGGWRQAVDLLLIFAMTLFLLAPLAAVVLRGLPGLASLPASVWPALLTSVLIALLASLLASTAALVLALAVARGAKGLELAAMLPMTASSLVLGTGIFLISRPFSAPEDLALPVTLLVNAALSLPFVFRLILPEARNLQQDFGRLAAALDLRGLARLRLLDLPRLARPLGFGAGVAAALSMGDLGVIALFASEDGATLPLVIQRLVGAYRIEQAAAASLLLVTASFVLFAGFDQLGRRHAAT